MSMQEIQEKIDKAEAEIKRLKASRKGCGGQEDYKLINSKIADQEEDLVDLRMELEEEKGKIFGRALNL